MGIIRALIVDDERLARQELTTLLQPHADIEVCGEAADVETAGRLADQLQPDVVFLDIQLAGETGFDLLSRTDVPFRVIFVTAFDAYAVRAFDVNALDYLLKPIQRDRLDVSLRRLRTGSGPQAPPSATLAYDDRLLLAIGRHRAFVTLNRIVCILAEADYSRVKLLGGAESLVLRPLREWEARLPERHFQRIHRATIANLNHVERVEGSAARGFAVWMRQLADPLPMSRRFASRVRGRVR